MPCLMTTALMAHNERQSQPYIFGNCILSIQVSVDIPTNV